MAIFRGDACKRLVWCRTQPRVLRPSLLRLSISKTSPVEEPTFFLSHDSYRILLFIGSSLTAIYFSREFAAIRYRSDVTIETGRTPDQWQQAEAGLLPRGGRICIDTNKEGSQSENSSPSTEKQVISPAVDTRPGRLYI